MNNINILSSAADQSLGTSGRYMMPTTPKAPSQAPSTDGQAVENPALRKAFDQFVGETFYGQMLQAMRKSQKKPAYFNGGRAEEVFSQQLDQALTKKLAETSANKLSGPMYDLFTQQRK